MNSGQMPAGELADGALILIGGTLMLTPGFVTDLLGIVLILPFTRPPARRALTGVVTRRLVGAGAAAYMPRTGPGNQQRPPPEP
ncbi:FxsA family protein [Nocardioides sp. B-3]|nr:FxsA family protein [Nocardioides sp. B-3]UUZ61795.1 FxsA family protein [Nocardioides sp. B-3]